MDKDTGILRSNLLPFAIHIELLLYDIMFVIILKKIPWQLYQ